MGKNYHIDIFLRHVNDGAVTRKPLLSVGSVGELNEVFADIKAVGVYCEFSGEVEHKAWIQYALSEEGAYAEIILGNGE